MFVIRLLQLDLIDLGHKFLRPVASGIMVMSQRMQEMNDWPFGTADVLDQCFTTAQQTPHSPQFRIWNNTFGQKTCGEVLRQLPGITPICLYAIPTAPRNRTRSNDGAINPQGSERITEGRTAKRSLVATTEITVCRPH